MTCTVGYFVVNKKKKKMQETVIVHLKGLIDIEINFSFFVLSVYRVRKTCQGPMILNNLDPSTHGIFYYLICITYEVATWVSYGTSLIVLVCSWLNHDVAI